MTREIERCMVTVGTVTEMPATSDRNVYCKGIEGEEYGLFFCGFSI